MSDTMIFEARPRTCTAHSTHGRMYHFSRTDITAILLITLQINYSVHTVWARRLLYRSTGTPSAQQVLHTKFELETFRILMTARSEFYARLV